MEQVSYKRKIFGGLILIGVVFIAAVIAGGSYRFYQVPSESMEPTLNIGDRVMVDSNAQIKKWDIVALIDPSEPDAIPLVKRVVATGGEEVLVKNGLFYVDKKLQYNPYIKGNRINWKNTRFKVPHGSFFVMGDNRNESYDSLNFGPVTFENILGKVTHIYWPKSSWGNLGKFGEFNDNREQ